MQIFMNIGCEASVCIRLHMCTNSSGARSVPDDEFIVMACMNPAHEI